MAAGPACGCTQHLPYAQAVLGLLRADELDEHRPASALRDLVVQGRHLACRRGVVGRVALAASARTEHSSFGAFRNERTLPDCIRSEGKAGQRCREQQAPQNRAGCAAAGCRVSRERTKLIRINATSHGKKA
jgi:hypothetical protein